MITGKDFGNLRVAYNLLFLCFTSFSFSIHKC